MPRAFLVGLGLGLVAAAAPAAADEPPPVPVGVAVADVTPRFPIRLNGYGSRKAESEGVATPLKAKALAIGGDDGGPPALLLTVENCGIPAHVTEAVAAKLGYTNDARGRLAVGSTHTHTAPCLSGNLPFIFGRPFTPEEQAHVDQYTKELTDAMVKVGRDALAARKPGRLAWAKGSVGFARNRRMLKDGKWVGFGNNPDGPTDHALPLLRVTDPDGKLRAVVAGYACHCTTLGGDFNKVCGDWAGFACEAIERDNPGAVALVVIGCGADADPQPRTGLPFAKDHGEAVAREVKRLLGETFTPLDGKVTASFRRITIPFGPTPTRDQYAERAKKAGAEGYYGRVMVERIDKGETLPADMAYPVQVWAFGDALAVVFLGGEVVVDYALRLKRECDPSRLWVVAYANDVPCYIASKRVLQEGGYEADASMVYYGKPTRLAPEAEDRIVAAVHDLLPAAFGAPARR
jgi:hypothetical protein